MTYPFHPDASLEYREAAAFYESRRRGLGAAFSLEVEAAIQRILEAHCSQSSGTHRILVGREAYESRQGTVLKYASSSSQ